MASESEGRPSRGIPAGRGPYGVGCVDVMAGLSTSGVFFRLFYPMDKMTDGPPRKQRPTWLPSNQYAKGYGAVVGSKLAGIAMKLLLSRVTLPVMWQGQLSQAKSKYPVVIFSHGLGGCRTTYTSTCIEMASSGCVVAAVEHRDKSACFSFIVNDDTTSAAGKENMKQERINFLNAPYKEQELRTKQVNQRKDECIATLDYLHDLNEGSALENDLDPDFDLSQFQGRLNTREVAMCGHSFGGATTVACLSRDHRFKCGVGMDVWMYPLDDSHMDVGQPVFFINTESFQWRQNMVPIATFLPDMQATTGPRQMITIRGTVHQSQSDLSLVVPSFLAKMAEVRGTLEPHLAMTINNQAALRFLSNYLDIETVDESHTSSYAEHILIGTNVNLVKEEDGGNEQESTQEDEPVGGEDQKADGEEGNEEGIEDREGNGEKRDATTTSQDEKEKMGGGATEGETDSAEEENEEGTEDRGSDGKKQDATTTSQDEDEKEIMGGGKTEGVEGDTRSAEEENNDQKDDTTPQADIEGSGSIQESILADKSKY